jgi:hypothetical protein
VCFDGRFLDHEMGGNLLALRVFRTRPSRHTRGTTSGNEVAQPSRACRSQAAKGATLAGISRRPSPIVANAAPAQQAGGHWFEPGIAHTRSAARDLHVSVFSDSAAAGWRLPEPAKNRLRGSGLPLDCPRVVRRSRSRSRRSASGPASVAAPASACRACVI